MTDTPDYLIINGRTMLAWSRHVTHEEAAQYVRRAYRLELPVLEPGGQWRSHAASGMGIIVNRAKVAPA